MEELGDAPELLQFFFRDPDINVDFDPNQLIPKKLDRERTRMLLQTSRDRLDLLDGWSEAALEATLRTLVAELGVKTGQLFSAIRVAVTGRAVAPPLFATLAVLGRDRAIARIAAAEKLLG